MPDDNPTSQDSDSETYRLAIPAPSGEDVHIIESPAGIEHDAMDLEEMTTKRMYLKTDAPVIEFDADEARGLAGKLRSVADSLEAYHDERKEVQFDDG